MSTLPIDKWRLSSWLTIDQAAKLVSNIDPNTSDDELSENDKKEIEACRSSLWETARFSEDNAGVKIMYATSYVDNEKYPSEYDSRVSAEWVKEQLSLKSITSGFFFPNPSPPSKAFMDPTHEHFSPELALAVTVWMALSDTAITKESPKKAITGWMKANPNAWLGPKPINPTAIERIAVLLNWQKEGGAPKSGS